MVRKSRKLRIAGVAGVCLAAAGGAGWWGTAVKDTISANDRATLGELSRRCRLAGSDTIGRVRAVQACVLQEIPHAIIAHREPREISDILAARRGECYDRARMIEKLLQMEGFQTRHVYLFPAKPYGWTGLFRLHLPSHALVDVRTERGWMSVGTNIPFLGLTVDGTIMASADLKKQSDLRWAYGPPSDLPGDVNLAVYGLWSRHGQFFPPFIPLPDISWRDFKYNLSADP